MNLTKFGLVNAARELNTQNTHSNEQFTGFEF